jgi:hypothetical protein
MFSRKKDPCGEIPCTSVTLAHALEKGYPISNHHFNTSHPNVMIRNSSRLAQAAQVISRDEFVDAVFRVWPKLQKRPMGMTTIIRVHHCMEMQTNLDSHLSGLAISGGVDSMSLAVMCKYYMPLLDIRAFIVDHKLRPTSTIQANSVVETLNELGDYYVFTAVHTQLLIAKSRHIRSYTITTGCKAEHDSIQH